MNKDLDLIIDKASIYVTDTTDCLLMRSRFKILNKSNMGVLLFIIISLLLLIISILKGNDWYSIIFGSLIGGLTFIFSIFALLKQVTDFVKVTKENIKFMSSLRSKRFRLNSEMKIKVKAETEYVKLKSHPSSGSYFRHIELYLVHNNSEFRVFNFKVDNKYSKEANKLGSELAYLIKKRINACNTI